MKFGPPTIELPRERAICSDSFKAWSNSFVMKFAGQKTAKSKAKEVAHQGDTWAKKSVKESFQKLDKLNIPKPRVESLTTNLLFACYLAKHSNDPNSDSVSDARAAYKLRINKLPQVVRNCRSLVRYLSENRDLASSALKYYDFSEISINAFPLSLDIKDVRVVEALLTRLADGFLHMQNSAHPGLMELDVEYRYGPLLIMNTDVTRVFVTGKKTNILDVGLMFHLTYILRHFTSSIGNTQLPSSINKHGELIIDGPMLKSGKKSRDIVAHLVNATFEKSKADCYSGEDVDERLEYLLKNKQEKPPKVGAPLSEVEFFGWSTELPGS